MLSRIFKPPANNNNFTVRAYASATIQRLERLLVRTRLSIKLNSILSPFRYQILLVLKILPSFLVTSQWYGTASKMESNPFYCSQIVCDEWDMDQILKNYLYCSVYISL